METEKKLTGCPSIDKPWLKYYTQEAINAPLSDCTIYEYMYRNNKDHLNDIAIQYLGKEITFGELFMKIDETAQAFAALGVQKGDVVTVAMPSIPEVLYVVYALNRLGAVANMIHPLAGESEICLFLNEVKSAYFVLYTGTYELIKDSLGKTSVKKAVVVSPSESLSPVKKFLYSIKTKEPQTYCSSVFQSWCSFIQAGKGVQVDCVSHAPDDLTLISHTGGTTGSPKGVMCSDRILNSLMYQITANFSYQRQGRSLAVLPPFINYSLVESMMAMLVIGYQVILIPKYKPELIGKYITDYKPTIVLSIPPYWAELLHIKENARYDFSSIEQAYYGGEGMDSNTEAQINAILRKYGSKVDLCKGLGATELGAGATQSYMNCNPINSVGIPLVHVNCKILDPETNEELGYNQEGEIAFTGSSLMLGYYGKPDATADVVHIHSDGKRWFHTGDMGYITEDGIIYVSGRMKRIMITKGEDGQPTKLFPDRIEKAILEHPAVELCCVIGVKDELRINYPKAVIVLNKQYKANAETEGLLRTFCKERLPDYMMPEVIEFRTDLPRTSRGKVDYRELEREVTNRE